MRIHRIRLTNYRGITSIDHPLNPSGVTVLEGPNESGKSCHVEALDNLLEEYDSARSRAIKDLTPSGQDVHTEVEADIETGPYRFTYRKRWNKGPETELRITQPRAETLTARPAHERVEEILRETVDVPLYKALRIIQGTGFDLPDLPVDSTLTRALDAAAGGTPITAREADLIQRAEEAYKQYWTEAGRAREVVRDADARLDAARIAETALATKIQEADADAERHENATRQIGALQVRRAPLETAAKEWETRRAAAESQQANLKTLDALHDAARNAHGAAAAAQAARQELVAEVERLDKAYKAVKKQFDEAVAAVEAAKTAAETTREKSDEAVTKADKERDLARIRKNDSDAIHLAFDLTLLEERNEKVVRAQEKRKTADETLARNRVTDAVLTKARSLQQDLALAASRLQDASPTLKILAKKAWEGKLDGKRISIASGKSHEVRVPNAARLDLGDAYIEVHAGTSLDDLQAAGREAKASLKELLDDHNLDSVATAIKAHKERGDAEDDKKRADGDIRDALRSNKILAFKSVNEMEAKVVEVRGRVAGLRAGRPASPVAAKNKDEAVRLSNEAQTAADDADRAVKNTRAASDAAAEEYARISEQQAVRKSRVEQGAEALQTATDRLADARHDTADDAVAQVVATRLEEQQKARKNLDEAKAEAVKTDPETVIDRAGSARDAVKRVNQEIHDLEGTCASLGGRLGVYAQQGLHESHQRAQAELEAANAAATSFHRRADTAKLLFTILRRHRTQAQRRYVAPLRERITRLGRYVYGDTFDVELDETLAVTSRTLKGTTLPYRSLSKGAKEQLSLILRLACAMTVTKDGSGVPLILDDALGFTDPKRLEAMGAVLDRAGRDCQVVLLTCTPDRYQAVSSAVVRRM